MLQNIYLNIHINHYHSQSSSITNQVTTTISSFFAFFAEQSSILPYGYTTIYLCTGERYLGCFKLFWLLHIKLKHKIMLKIKYCLTVLVSCKLTNLIFTNLSVIIVSILQMKLGLGKLLANKWQKHYYKTDGVAQESFSITGFYHVVTPCTM